MKKIYLSGKMTGLPDLGFPIFHAEAQRLRGLGYEVVNPAELNPDPNADWSACLREDIKHLMDCDAIAMLDNWTTSKGAILEMQVAHRVGIQIRMARGIVA